MIIPSYLNHGDRIRIVSPAGKVSREKIMPGIELLKKEGFEVIIGNHVFSKHFQFAGNDNERAQDFQEAINDDRTKAIVCARGGYGSVRILEKIDFSVLINFPKWLVGFSDITVLHSAFAQLGIASIHGPMPGSFKNGNTATVGYKKVIETLKGDLPSLKFEPHGLNRTGTCQGTLTGGNLSLIESLQGTPFQINTEGKILFLEDLSEHLYHIDRMMNNLYLSGKLENLTGLIVGGFTEMKDDEPEFGKSAYEIIREVVDRYHYPVCFNVSAGHIRNNYPLVFGVEYQLAVGQICSLNPG